MDDKMRTDASTIIETVIAENMPEKAVEDALRNHEFSGNIYLVAIGKAAWTMASAASSFLGERLKKGLVITKYDHAQGPLPRVEIIEAGHPVPDENSILGTEKALELAARLTAEDELIFLISGGGSALFEKPRDGVTLADLQDITSQLLAVGADIVEINMVRKRLSAVKAGRFAEICAPAKVFCIILSDVLGDRLDSIASGPLSPDLSTVSDAEKVVQTYALNLTERQRLYLSEETPKEVVGVKTLIMGSVRTLTRSAAECALKLGYTPYILTNSLNCEASEAGRFFASIAQDIHKGESTFKRPCAIIAGGETVVTLKGSGKGGRNQELSLSAAQGIKDLSDTLIFSLGSDGTDGPTDAAGGIADGETVDKLKSMSIDIEKSLADNDSYHALKAIDALIMTGPTGTNVNDVVVLLCG